MYQTFLTKRAIKEVKKRGNQFKEKTITILNTLKTNPNPIQSERLTGELNFLYSYHFSFKGTAYRLVYSIEVTKKIITVVMIGPRENFYRSLKHIV